MSGRLVVLALLAVAVLFGVGLWYMRIHAWYEEVAGLSEITVAGRAVPVADYRGIDAPSPLKRRGCFRVDPALLADAPPAGDATPLAAPGWFDCFDHARLTADLAAGRARAILASREDAERVETVIALYPDGTAFLWRQLQKRYRT